MSLLYLLVLIKLYECCIDTIYYNNDTNIECTDLSACIYDINQYCDNNCDINVNIGNNVTAINISICLLCDSNTLCSVGIHSEYRNGLMTCNNPNEYCMIPVSLKCSDNECQYNNQVNCECLLSNVTNNQINSTSTVNTTAITNEPGSTTSNNSLPKMSVVLIVIVIILTLVLCIFIGIICIWVCADKQKESTSLNNNYFTNLNEMTPSMYSGVYSNNDPIPGGYGYTPPGLIAKSNNHTPLF